MSSAAPRDKPRKKQPHGVGSRRHDGSSRDASEEVSKGLERGGRLDKRGKCLGEGAAARSKNTRVVRPGSGTIVAAVVDVSQMMLSSRPTSLPVLCESTRSSTRPRCIGRRSRETGATLQIRARHLIVVIRHLTPFPCTGQRHQRRRLCLFHQRRHSRPRRSQGGHGLS